MGTCRNVCHPEISVPIHPEVDARKTTQPKNVANSRRRFLHLVHLWKVGRRAICKSKSILGNGTEGENLLPELAAAMQSDSDGTKRVADRANTNDGDLELVPL